MPIQTAIDSISNNQGSPFGFKNRIINGGMVIDQRNAGASLTPGNGSYTVDRWIYYGNQSSKATAQQNAASVTPPSGYKNYLGITSSSAYSVLTGDYFCLAQHIEGFNIADLGWGTASASSVTLSFWVRSSLTGTFGGVISNAGSRSYPFTYTINSANTWEYETITIPGDTSGPWGSTNSYGITVYLGLGVGATYSGTAGSWSGNNYFSATGATSVVGTSGATFYITGVQFEKGTQATAFDYRPYGTELQLCQRYFYSKTREGSSSNQIIGISYWSGSTIVECVLEHPVTMRSSPSISADTISDFFALVPQTAWNAASTIGLNEGGPYTTKISFTCATNNSFSTDGRRTSVVGIRGDSGRLKVDAEL